MNDHQHMNDILCGGGGGLVMMDGEAWRAHRAGVARLMAAGVREGVKPRGMLGSADSLGNFRPYVMHGSVAVVTVDGPIMFAPDWFDQMMGAVGWSELGAAALMAAADPAAKRWMLRINSGGGAVAGMSEGLAALKRAAGMKPAHAMVNEACHSMAVAIAACASEIVCTSSALMGWVGTLIPKVDDSEMYAKIGLKPVPRASCDNKASAAAGMPDTPALKEMDQRVVDVCFAEYAAHVAAGTGMSLEAVKGMQASVYIGADIVKVGLAKRIVPGFEAYVAELNGLGENNKAPGVPVAKGSVGTPAGKPVPQATPKGMKMTENELRAAHGDVIGSIEGKAKKAGRDELIAEQNAAQPKAASFDELHALFGAKDMAFVGECQVKKLPVAAAQAAWNEKVEAKALAAETKATELQAKVSELEKKKAGAGGNAPAPHSQSSTGAAPVAAGGVEKHPFEARCAAVMAEKKCDMGKALSLVAREDPAAHAAYVAEKAEEMKARKKKAD